MTADETCKIDHVVDRFGLSAPGQAGESIDRYLVDRWTGADDGAAVGYKGLTEWFNKRLMKRVYERNGRDTIGTRIESEYEALRGDDDLVRTEVVEDLRADGVDADALVDAMVSWSTMRRHLKRCLEAEKAAQPARTEWELESLDIARNQVTDKAQSALKSLSSKRELPDAHRATVEVQVKLSCPECPTRVPLEDAVERGYVCRDHFDSATADGGRGSTLSDAASRAILPLGILQSIALDAFSAEEVFSVVDAIASVPL